jgi:hypothetical protein
MPGWAVTLVVEMTVAIGLLAFGLYWLVRQLRRQPKRDTPSLRQRCAACGEEVDGPTPVQVDDVVELVGHPPVKVRFYICAKCVGYHQTQQAASPA